MRKLIPILLLLMALVLPCCASAATVSGTLTQISGHSTRLLDKISVTLEGADGTTYSAVTNKDGEYRFTSVGQGQYRIRVDLPSDHVPAYMNEDNWLLLAQDHLGQTDWFEVDGNKTVNLASTRATVFVKFVAFVDENANGGRMNSEPALRDVQVSIHPAGHPDIVVASGTTDRKGELTLGSLSPGEYQVKVIYPENFSAGPLGTKLNFYYNCIKSSETQEAWSEPFRLESGSQGIGIGAVATGSAEGHIWYDANANGRKDTDEAGLAGVQVAMIADSDGLTRTALTDEAGNYTFARLQPGAYTVRVTAPEGYMFAAENSGSWLTEGYSDTDQGTVTVTAENTLRVREVGLMKATALQVVFYQDENANGMHDPNEAGYAGADVTVSSQGRTVAHLTSDDTGTVTVPIIRAGKAQVTAQLNEADIFSPTGLDNDFAQTLPASFTTVDTELAPGQLTTLYAAVTSPAQVGGMLFMDDNNDGKKADSEAPVEGFTVQAVDWNGQVVDTAMTDARGQYHFDRLLPIPHTIRFLLNDPYIASPYAEGGNSIVSQNSDYGETAQLQLLPGSFTGNVNGGLFKAGTISGRILLTDDRPAGMGAGLDGVTVTLVDLNGQPVSDYTTVYSETDGSYYLKGILPGEYKLRYTLPADSLFAETDELTVESVSFVSGQGTDTALADLYAVRTATIEGQVICEGQPASAVITVVNTENGYTVSFPAESASGGHFALHLLRPGTWQVTVELDEGYSFAEDTDLVPAVAQHVSSRQYTFAMGDELLSQRILVTRPATVTGRLFQDEDLSGSFDEGEAALSGYTVTLVNRDGEAAAQLTTDENGCFESPKLIPGRYQVTVALEDDCILLDGAQVSAESWAQQVEAVSGRNTDAAIPVLRFASIGGKLWSLDEKLAFVAGLTVELYAADSLSVPLSVTKTDKQGQYLFPRLYPGSYRLSVKLPEGHGFARRADTDETHVSLIVSNDNTEMSDTLQLKMGVNITNADFGFGAKGSIGDLAWLDLNGNGMQDIGEPGIPGIRLQLIQGDELLAETETDIYGHYMFEGIYPGRYTLRVTMHPELKATVHQTDFPLIGSVLPESDELTVDANDVIVPSGTRNLAVDVGFMPREDGVYPAVIQTIPTTDWSFGGKKR